MLSASVMFISLPGLDDICRLAGFVAIALSASSMVSAVIALFRYKAEVEHPIVHVGGEGLLVISVCRVELFLPAESLTLNRATETKCRDVSPIGLPCMGHCCICHRRCAIPYPRSHDDYEYIDRISSPEPDALDDCRHHRRCSRCHMHGCHANSMMWVMERYCGHRIFMSVLY